MTFAMQLVAERERTGLTQDVISNRLDVPARTYWEWEHGKTEPWTVAQEGALARLRKIKTRPLEDFKPK